MVLDTQSVKRFALLTVLRCARTPNGPVSVGIPALPALRVDGTPDYEGRNVGGAENLTWLIHNQAALTRGRCRCRVCRSSTEFLPESVAASYPEARQADYCKLPQIAWTAYRNPQSGGI